jgi:hypothetical protein
MQFFDWVNLIDWVSTVTIGGLIMALSVSWQAEHTGPDPTPAIRDRTDARRRGALGYLPIPGLLSFLASGGQRLRGFSRLVTSRMQDQIVPDARSGLAAGQPPGGITATERTAQA